VPEEIQLMELHGLDAEQIAWRRKQWRLCEIWQGKSTRRMRVRVFWLPEIVCLIWRRSMRQWRAPGKVVQSQDNGRLLSWFPFQKGRRYIIGVDSAGGGSQGDYACAEVIEQTIGLQCAELRGHFPPLELATRVVELVRVTEGRCWRWNEIIMVTGC